jgi:type II secretory pathway component PulF
VIMIPDSVSQRIDAALSLKDDIALSLAQAADALSGRQRRELLRLSERVAAVESAEEVLQDAKLLELLLPLAKMQPELARAEDSARKGEVQRQVFQVLQRQTQQTRARNERWSVLIYPLLILLLSTLVFAFIAIEIVPVFEQMFDEFDLAVPASTQLVILVSHLMQSIWFWVLLVVLFAVPTVMLALRAADSLRYWFSDRADPWFSAGYSTRRSLGDLAWHTALLLDIGQEVETAVQIAGAASRKSAMRRASPDLARHLGVATLVSSPQNSPLAASQPYAAANWYLGVPCHLLTHALNTGQDDVERSAMLREIASLYWDREQTTSIWILSWLQPIAVSMISLVVGFVVLALFMPLVELISGLT